MTAQTDWHSHQIQDGEQLKPRLLTGTNLHLLLDIYKTYPFLQLEAFKNTEKLYNIHFTNHTD